MTMLDSALQYLDMGCSVIPNIENTKKYYIEWAPYQQKLPTTEEVKKWWTQNPNAGIGIITGVISGLLVIDLDIYKNPNAKQDIEPYIPDSLVFPIAETPSGGEHWYFRCVDSTLRSQNPISGFKDIDVKARGGAILAPPSIRDGKQYKWKKGLELGTVRTPLIPKALYDILPKDAKTPETVDIAKVGSMFISGRRDEDLFHIAFALVRAKLPGDEIYQTLLRLSQACDPPFPIKEAEAKVLSALRRASEQPRDITKEVQQWCVTQDKFRIESCFNELSLLSKEHKAACRTAVMDLVTRGVVEKDKGIGVYRLVSNSLEIITIPDKTPEPLPFKWPFGIEELVDIYSGNVAVIAGNSNAGKTAFLLNCAEKNKENFRIRYQSSEMDGAELALRLKGFGVGLQTFRDKVEWVKRSSDWWDLILPDDVNIIDFMEIHEDFYLMGAWIKKVFDKLRKGIAIIAIQKKDSTTDMGRGGAVTKEKARLYLSMDFGMLTIVKAKNWADFERDPNGLKIAFNLKRSVNLENDGPWTR